MIDRNKDIVEWAILGHLLHEGREHLDDLLKKFDKDDFDETEFAVRLSHIYAHLNQTWNGRNKKGDWSDADYETFRQYPSDLQPDGPWPPPSET